MEMEFLFTMNDDYAFIFKLINPMDAAATTQN